MNSLNNFSAWLVIAGLFGGFVYGLKETSNYIGSPSYVAKTKLEVKVDSLQDKKNYWIALKDSSELTTLAEGFINNYDEQISTLKKSISAIENDSEYKRLRGKANSSSDGLKIIGGSILLGMVVSTYYLIKDKRQKKRKN